jgi:hypothetical protein
MRIFNLILVSLVLVAATSACSGTGPRNVERDYGNSVRQMVAGQTLDPATANNPDPNPVDSGDGDRLNNVLEAYRGDFSKPAEVGRDIQINVSK